MLSRVAAVMAPRTHNRHRVTGSSGRREGRESEPQRPNMSRHHFYSAVLLLVLVMMCCNAGGAEELSDSLTAPKFVWKVITEGETVKSLGFPGLLKVGNDVFAVAEAQCKKNSENSGFTGIASQLLTEKKDSTPVEIMNEAKKYTQVLEEGTSPNNKKVDVSRPTTILKESDIYMLVGKYSRTAATNPQESGGGDWGLLLVKGEVCGEGGESEKKIQWNKNQRLAGTFPEAERDSLMQLVAGGGSGVQTDDGTLVFPVEGKKKGESKEEKTVSLLIYTSEDSSWTLSKGMSDDGCSDPSVVEWEKDKKLIMMTACDGGRRRVYESGDKGESWTEALGTLSRVWGNTQGGKAKGVRSGFITARIDNRDVMLVTLPVDSSKDGNAKGKLHLWLTDNTHIIDIGPVSDDDAAASSLLYKSGDNIGQLIALYEKKGGDDVTPHSLLTVTLNKQLEKVKEVLKAWNEVDETVSKLCPSSAEKDGSPYTACSPTVKITDGLVGFLSGNFSENTWRDEYLGVNATVNSNEGVEQAKNGVTFKGRGAGAQWPVGSQGENQLYHFANYNFTLVATVSIDKVPKEEEGSPIPLLGVRAGSDGGKNLMELSYETGKKWKVLCGGENPKELSSTSEETTHHVVILLRNGNQGSAYVDGQRVGGDAPCELKVTEPNEISHFYIGGDGKGTESGEGVFVTVTNVLLYNRPLSTAEIGAFNPNKDLIQPLDKEAAKPSTVSPTSVITPVSPETPNAQHNGASSIPAGKHLTEQGQSIKSSKGKDSGGASASAVPTVSTSSAEKESVVQVASGKSSDGTQNVDGGSTGDGEPAMEKREGTDAQEEEIKPLNRDENATALSSSLGNVSQGNNSDAGTMRGRGLPLLLLLLLGLWVFAAL
ncbi:putative trans-sialidase, Group V [Trypanosoma cruzi]|nr:putative trans-sialidase, Group V [Trypanosoma cruzi]